MLKHQLAGPLQAFSRYLVSSLATHLHHVAILYGAATEHYEKHDERQQRQQQANPICRTVKEDLARSGTACLATLYGMYVVVDYLVKALCCPLAVARRHVDDKRLGMQRFVGVGVNIIIYERHRRNGVLALVARHGKEIVYHVSTYSGIGEFCLVRHLRVVLVESLRELHYRLLYELQVSRASHDNPKSDWRASLYLLAADARGDVKLAYAT